VQAAEDLKSPKFPLAQALLGRLATQG
jgi:hypothetical protein